jgi:hypothetical protein
MNTGKCRVTIRGKSKVCDQCDAIADENGVIVCAYDYQKGTIKEISKPHYHVNEVGKLVRCYHACKSLLTSIEFWVGTIVSSTLSFPIEHALWEKTPLHYITEWLGL